MKKQKLVIILVILILAGVGIGLYIAVRAASKDAGSANQQQKTTTNSNSGSDNSDSSNNSDGSKSSTSSNPKQTTPNQQEKKPGKPQPNQKEQRIDPVRPKHNPVPQPPSSPAVPPKNNQRPAPQPQQPGNSQQPAPNPQPNPTPTPNPQPQPADQDKKYGVGPPDASEILELINYARSKENLKPLEMYEPLNQTAQLMANDMKENNYFSHYRPGTTTPYGLLKVMSVCRAPAENLVQTSPPNLHTSRVAFNAWMQSSPHRQSIMSSTYTLTGFGIAGNKIVEHFC